MKSPTLIPLHRAASGQMIAFERIERTEEEVRNSVHRHEYAEIFVFAKGTGTHMIDLQVHQIDKPCMHLVRAGQVHQLIRSWDMEGFVIEFTPEALGDTVRRADAEALFAAMVRKPGLPLDAQRLDILNDLARMLEAEIQDGGPIQVLANYLGIALAKSVRWWTEQLPDEGAADAMQTDLIDRFRALVDVHFLEYDQIREYAHKLHVTPGHLTDVVRNRLGTTPSALIDERLLLEAKRLLLHSELSVKESGFSIGMKDPAYFARWFKKLEGCTPVEYRGNVRERFKA